MLNPHAPFIVSQVSSGRVPISESLLNSAVRPPGRSFSNIWKSSPGIRPSMMIRADQRLRLELVDQRVGPIEMPLRVRAIPPAVEPDAADVAVVGQQLAQLPVHVLEILVEVPRSGRPGILAGAAARVIVRVVPVELRVVEEQLQALLAAFLGERFQHVLLVRRPIDDVVVRDLRVEHREAVVVLAGDGDVLHARRPWPSRPTARRRTRSG